MWLLAGVACGIVLLFAGFSVYVSGVVRRGAFEPTRSIPDFDLEVAGVSGDRITIRPAGAHASPRWRQEGVWGLEWDGGHGRIGTLLEIGAAGATRHWTPFAGKLSAGERARIGMAAFPSDPRAAFGLEFRAVTYESGAGEFEGHLCEGPASTWLLLVHGKRAARPARPPYSYPILPLAREFGLPCFDVAYRNDRGAPSEDGLHWYGLREWKDLEGAARYALDHGAERLILAGYSMGGAIAVSFLYRSPLAGRVAGVVLDAPVLDLRTVVETGIRNRGIPQALTRPGLWLAMRRLGADWEWFDYLKDAHRLEVPILLFHGGADSLVPAATSERLAGLRPDIVTYVRVPASAHAHSWNVDPAGYEARVRAFLGRVV